jgi:hypothetical protein
VKATATIADLLRESKAWRDFFPQRDVTIMRIPRSALMEAFPLPG